VDTTACCAYIEAAPGHHRETRLSTAVAQQGSAATLPTVWTVLARPLTQVVIGVAGLLGAAGAFALVATSDHLVDPVAYGLQISLLVAGTVAAALLWIVRRPGNRIALLLLVLALAGLLISLQGASQPLLHSIGVADDVAMFMLAYVVVFAFPYGRVSGVPERLILAGFAGYFLVGFVPYLFFSPIVSGGAPLAGCNAQCPTNALMIDDRPRIAASFGSDLAWVVIALASATILCLVYRLVTASRPRRRALLPVYVPALMLTVPLLAFHGFAAGILHLEGSTLERIGWSVTFGRTLLPYGFLLAIVQTSFFAGSALKRIMGRVGTDASAAQLRSIVAESLDDPSLELAFRVDRSVGFLDSRGEPVPASRLEDRRTASPVGRQGETVAVILHDPALSTDPELVRAAGQAVLLALEAGRLETELRSTTDELVASRARLLAVGDAERRKLERDLHDGAQQHLIALRMKVGLARELAEKDPEVAARLADVGNELEVVLHELRNLAGGVYPPTLRELGLGAALTAVAQRSVPPATVEVDGIGRYPAEIEAAVYFACVEALQNAGKHAGANARTDVRLWQSEGVLCFEIRDDGVGFDLASSREGVGLVNMADRVAALAGTLAVDSAPGGGTRVRGLIPLSA
jgi:signal transduction histidine kinase